jgi:ethanolamine transporter EutH
MDISGMVAALATALPMYSMYGDMTPKGMIVNAAFGVGASWALGDHLSYLAPVQGDMVIPMIVGKLTAGAIAILLCLWCANFFVKKGVQAAKKDGVDLNVGEAAVEMDNVDEDAQVSTNESKKSSSPEEPAEGV